ncbi:MAG: hypothetical protein QNJ46_21895, partial [Leptolyngbyaceae cyanobacterium MO_188.B28]|nr:hypothetical protein [Leptolyngbyaceae cyanobacterium MO_188.B28]
VEAASVIEKAYKEGPMDEMVCGSWARVQISLGLAAAADFTPEELRHKTPEWMKPIQKVAKLIELGLPDEAPDAPAKMQTASEELQLPEFGKGSKRTGKSKSSQPKSGFGSQRPQEKKKKRKSK